MIQILLIFIQDGQGCDYTIGCGINYKIIELETGDDFYNRLNEEVEIILSEEYTEERKLKKLRMFQLAGSIDFDLDDFYNKNVEEEKSEEYKTYLELKNKFE